MAAILNKHQVGTLWFGVRNDGAIAGIGVNEKTLRDLSQSIAAHIEPRIYPQITLESLQGNTCIKVAFKGKDAPYFAYGKAYMRVADEDRQLSARELEQRILAKHRDYRRPGLCTGGGLQGPRGDSQSRRALRRPDYRRAP